MFRLIWAASVRTHSILSYAPTNLLLAAIRTRRGLKWGVPAMLLAVPYLLLAKICTNFMADGGPGWPNLLVLLLVWNAMKFVFIGPISMLILTRIRIREAVSHHQRGKVDAGAPTVGAAR